METDPILEHAAVRFERSLKPRKRLVRTCAVIFGIFVVLLAVFTEPPFGPGRIQTLLISLPAAWFGAKKFWDASSGKATMFIPIVYAAMPILAAATYIVTNCPMDGVKPVRETWEAPHGVLAGKAGLVRPVWIPYVSLPCPSVFTDHDLKMETVKTKTGIRTVYIRVDHLALRYIPGQKAAKVADLWADESVETFWAEVEIKLSCIAVEAAQASHCKPLVTDSGDTSKCKHGLVSTTYVAQTSPKFQHLMHDPRYLNPRLAKLGLEVDTNRTKE